MQQRRAVSQRQLSLLLPARDALLATVSAVVVCFRDCLSVYVSVTRRYCIETAARIELVFCSAYRLPSTYATLCSKEIKVSRKIRVLPSGTLSKTLYGLGKFRHGMLTVSECHMYKRQRSVCCTLNLARVNHRRAIRRR